MKVRKVNSKISRKSAAFAATLLLASSVLIPFFPNAGALGAGLNLSENPGISSDPMIAGSGSDVYAVWKDDSDSDNDIWFLSSSDNGATFGNATNISSNSGFSLKPQIAASGSNVYLVWQDNTPGSDDILFAASSDNGATFDIDNISSNDGLSSSPQIAASGSNVYLVWQDNTPGSDDILFAASSDNGATFGNATNISNNEGSSTSAELIATGDDIYIAWQDSDPGNYDILFVASDDGGATFGNTTNVSESEGNSFTPQLVVFENNIYATWMDDTDGGDFDIMFSASADGGDNFSPATNVSNNDATSASPQLVVSVMGDDLYIVWYDYQFDSSNGEVLLAASDDGGDSFGCPINLSATPGDSSLPQMILEADGSNVHVIWQDSSLENTEILFQADIDPLASTITLDSISNTSPKWDDEIEISGSAANAAGSDTVTVDWGDDSETTGIDISGCSWGPVSHTYTGSAIETNPNQLVATLVGSGGAEKDTSAISDVEVKPHATALSLDFIPSVVQGSELSVTGRIIDLDSDETGIDDLSISFSGSGASNLTSALTESGGEYASIGQAVDFIADGLLVQAHFEGDELYDPAESEIRSYDTASLSASVFPVSGGSNIHANLTGYNTSIDFDNVLSDGVIFVSECTTASHSRYLSMDLCLRISPGIQLGDGVAVISMSYEDGDIPDGHSEDEIDLFHVTPGDEVTVLDVTSFRDPDSNVVEGEVTSFSNFVIGIATHGSKPQGYHWTPVLVGNGNVAELRDINNPQNSSATATIQLDSTSYNVGQDAVVIVNDPNGDVEPSENDIVTASVQSETSRPASIFVTLTETGQSTGIFGGSFTLTSGESSTIDRLLNATSGDEISLSYTSGARFKATLDGMSQAGIVQLSDYIVEDGVCFVSEGGGVDLSLVDAELGPAGKISVTISYANVILGSIDPSSLILMHKESGSWFDITDVDSDGNPIGVDTDAKTVSGTAFSPGPFSLAVNVDDCAGGAGGGFGRGLVVDAVASIAKKSSSSGSSGGGGGSGGTSGTPSSSAATSIQTGQDVSSTTNKVSISFENVVTAGSVNVEERQVSAADNMFTSVESGHGRFISVDSSSFNTAGSIFEIKLSTGLQFQGTVDVTIPYSESLAGTAPVAGSSSPEENVRFMHFDGSSWQDLTIGVDTVANTVTGRMSSFSPVVAAVVEDGTFGREYYLEHPMQRLAPVSGSGLSFTDSQGSPLSTIPQNQDVNVLATIQNQQRVSQDYIYIVEVFDSDGIVVDIDMVAGSIISAQTATIKEGSLRAGDDGTYTVKVFLLTPGENPQLLSDVLTTEIQVA